MRIAFLHALKYYKYLSQLDAKVYYKYFSQQDARSIPSPLTPRT